MIIKGIIVSDMPNILFNHEVSGSKYYGYRHYKSAICPICGERYFYNKKHYSDGHIPPTCGRYSCLRGLFLNA